MKVCLISPPTVTEFDGGRIAEQEAVRLIAEHAPLGILSLAAVLTAQDIEPHVIDLNWLYYEYLTQAARRREGISFSAYVTRSLESLSFDIFGFSSICSSYPLTLRLAREVKRSHPSAMIIMGGPQASVVDVPTLREFPFVDIIVRGEAEITLPRLLEKIERGGGGLSQLDGITYRTGGEVVRNRNAPVITDLDSLPLPAFHLYPHIGKCSYIPLEAGRGCPFACSFCSTNDFFRRRFRLKSPHVLVEQMGLLKERYGVSSFDLVHDMFTVDRKKVVSFCQAVEASGQQFSWSCSARTDCIDEELISRMARAGCSGVFFGIDTGSERMQAIINKGLDLRDAVARVESTKRHGIKTTVSLIAGYPEETLDDLRATVRFYGDSLRHSHTDTQLHLLAPLAETPITTQHRDQLVYDEIFSDISFHGWDQDPEDRAMIVEHRDIFPNFYSVPTPHLDRQHLRELREFLLHGSMKHRWLMTFLHQDSGDLLSVFDAWKAWRISPQSGSPVGERGRSYYMSARFSEDFLRFLRSGYVQTLRGHSHLLTTMVEMETALFALYGGQSVRRAGGQVPATVNADSVPVVPEGVRVVDVEADYKRLVACLRRAGRFDRLPAERVSLALIKGYSKIRIRQLNHITRRLLRLCDGSRNVLEVMGSFAATEKIEGMSPHKAGFHGLLLLSRQGLITMKRAAA
jgi:radical SAM superfamily enzyme YgiQ (UPF0313 family)